MKKLNKAGIITDEVVDVANRVKDIIAPDRDFTFWLFWFEKH